MDTADDRCPACGGLTALVGRVHNCRPWDWHTGLGIAEPAHVTVTKPRVTAAKGSDVTADVTEPNPDGRPPLGSRAMTSTERMRKLRAKAKALKRVEAVSD